jgi:hypothetical protein
MKVNPIIRYARGLWGFGWIALVFVFVLHPAILDHLFDNGLIWAILFCYVAAGTMLNDRPWSRVRNDLRRWAAQPTPVKSVEDRLDELERLKRRDMVTPEEYTAKRQEILKDL